LQEPSEAGAAATNKIARAFNRLEALHHSADGGLGFHPGERHPGAGVDARAKGKMPVGLAADIETVGVGELGRIAIGCADPDMDLGASRHRDVAQHRVLRRPAVAELVRAFDASSAR
jgi:hypothetical protein